MSDHRPRFDGDLYTDAAIADPHPIHRAIRDAGPAVWLSAHGAWAIGRFRDVRAALRADEVLVSGHGIALNDVVNWHVARVTLTTDGPVHRTLRRALMKPMMPSALVDVQAQIQERADRLVEELGDRRADDRPQQRAARLPRLAASACRSRRRSR